MHCNVLNRYEMYCIALYCCVLHVLYCCIYTVLHESHKVTSSCIYIIHSTAIEKNAAHPIFCCSPKWCRVDTTIVDMQENTA
jgi:hypothetical protein